MKRYVNLYRNSGGGMFAGVELYASAEDARRAAKNERSDNWAGVAHVLDETEAEAGLN
jgi:hypothetical protein